MCKVTKISSEIRNFFTEKRQSTVMNDFTRLLESLALDNRCLGGDKHTQFMLDASLHGEKDKTEGMEQGLTAKQRKERYSRERDGESRAAELTGMDDEVMLELITRVRDKRIPKKVESAA